MPACAACSPSAPSPCSRPPAFTSSTGEPSSPVVVAQTVITCPDCQLVDVTRVIDGDTIDTSIGRVRLYGLNTPERGDVCSGEATAAMGRLAGNSVRLEDGPRFTDDFGRRLAYVYDASGNSIDVQLIVGGFARAWTQDGQHRDLLVAMEQSAREGTAGCLWG